MLPPWGARMPGQWGDFPYPPPSTHTHLQLHLQIGYQAPITMLVMKSLGNSTTSNLPRLNRIPSESQLEDMNKALRTVPTIIETNRLIYTAATVVLEILRYKMNSNCRQKARAPSMEKMAGDKNHGYPERS